MESKRRSSAPKSLGKSQSSSKLKERKNSSPAVKEPQRKKEKGDTAKNMIAQLVKKPAGPQLVKKKIEDLKAPELLIKVNYKNKRISIPIVTCDDKSLNDTVMPHIIRF